MKQSHTQSLRTVFAMTALTVAWLSLSSCCSAPQCDSCCAVQSAAAAPGTPAVTTQAAPAAPKEEAPVKNGEEALQRLMEGNKRFVAFKLHKPNANEERRQELDKGQQPFATIFSCVDSRVPPELVFDRGLGDLFVTRTAGQVADKSVLGSIEYGAEHLHIPLLMILGHTNCGAVKATIETVESNGHVEGNVGALIDGIRPAVVKAKTAGGGDLLDKAVRANVELAVERMKNVPALSNDVKLGHLKIVGAVYNLDSGVVEITVP